MNCIHCNTELIFNGNGEVTGVWDSGYPNDKDYLMVTNLTCPNCDSFYRNWFVRKEDIVEIIKKKGNRPLSKDEENELLAL